MPGMGLNKHDKLVNIHSMLDSGKCEGGKKQPNKTREERCQWGWGGIESLDQVVREDSSGEVRLGKALKEQSAHVFTFKIHLIYSLGRERRAFAV